MLVLMMTNFEIVCFFFFFSFVDVRARGIIFRRIAPLCPSSPGHFRHRQLCGGEQGAL